MMNDALRGLHVTRHQFTLTDHLWACQILSPGGDAPLSIPCRVFRVFIQRANRLPGC